ELHTKNVGGRARRRRVEAAALQQVCAIEGRRAHTHAHTVARSLGPRDLTHLQAFDPAALRDHDRAHALSFHVSLLCATNIAMTSGKDMSLRDACHTLC